MHGCTAACRQNRIQTNQEKRIKLLMRYKGVGPPGTGKTRRLLNEVHNYVKKGVPLNRIGYFAFTRKAAKEARNRYLDVEKHLT